MEDKLKQLIDQSERILITSHISPDPDAVASTLLTGLTLRDKYPDKEVSMVLEEEPEGLSFLPGYDKLRFSRLDEFVAKHNPDLIIMVDVSNLSRASRAGGGSIRDHINSSGTKLIIIDHHLPEGQDDSDLCINSSEPSAASAIYNLLFKKLGLSKLDTAAEITMVGLYADTGGFIYIDKNSLDSFRLISELVSADVSIEKIKYQLSQLSENQMKVIGELCNNVSHSNDYSFSFLSDEFVDNWLKSGKDSASLQKASKTFVDNYLRVIDGRPMGFSFYRSPLDPKDTYSVSFRSVKHTENVAKIAQKLNGGGHPSAAGGKVVASSIQDALEKIIQAIPSN